MRTVADLVSTLEARGVVFWVHGALLRFDCEDAALRPGDPALVGELVLQRESEAIAFLRRREKTDEFGKFAGAFRLMLFRFLSPKELVPWLRERCPKLHRDLTVTIPDELQRIWEEGEPIEEFERTIRRLEETRFRAMSFYAACRGGEREKEVSHARRL